MKPYKRINFRVVIHVPSHPWIDDGKDAVLTERFLNDHANDLRKVVKPVAEAINDRTYGEPFVMSDLVCRFCESPWENNPECCNDAIEERERANTVMPTSGSMEIKK